jgi:hypothetical protein
MQEIIYREDITFRKTNIHKISLERHKAMYSNSDHEDEDEDGP